MASSDEPIRVLFFSSGFPPGIGGIEPLAGRLVRGLAARGVDFRVVVPQEAATLYERAPHHGVEVHQLAFSRAVEARDPVALHGLRRVMAKLKREFRPHVIHLNGFHPALILHLETEKIHSCPTLVSVHGWLHLALGPRNPVGRVLRDANRIVTCSEYAHRETLRRIPEIADRTSVLANAAEPPPFAPSPLPFDPPRLLCFGRLIEDKGFDVAIDAFARLLPRHPALRLRLAGSGPHREALERKVRERGVAHGVDFVGPVPSERIPDLVDRATVVLVPSRWAEPFGMVALEASLMARPVVASRVGGLPEIIQHGENGLLVPPGDPAALADAAEQLITQPERAVFLGQEGRRLALKRFDWKSYENSHWALYRALAREA